MNKLTIVLTGKKQSGKSTMCNYIRARYLNLKQKSFHFGVDKDGLLTVHTWIDVETAIKFRSNPKDGREEIFRNAAKNGKLLLTCDNANEIIAEMTHKYPVKVYSFADPLKDFCINVLGVPHEGCWGTDVQKNTPVPHLLWENLPEVFHPKIDTNNYDSGAGEDHVNPPKSRTGPMTGREVMQVFGTDICRRLYGDCWARGTYNKIKSEGVELALVADARFPNEITIGTEVKATTVRLGRNVSNDNHASEIALDDFPKEGYTLFVDNTDFSIAEQCAFFDPHIDKWFADAGIA